jgi:hypothetical protein
MASTAPRGKVSLPPISRTGERRADRLYHFRSRHLGADHSAPRPHVERRRPPHPRPRVLRRGPRADARLGRAESSRRALRRRRGRTRSLLPGRHTPIDTESPGAARPQVLRPRPVTADEPHPRRTGLAARRGLSRIRRTPQEFEDLPAEIDHIIAEVHGGRVSASNLALSCLHCNRHKGPNLSGMDPQTRLLSRLFHPRRYFWPYHFQGCRGVSTGTVPDDPFSLPLIMLRRGRHYTSPRRITRRLPCNSIKRRTKPVSPVPC